MYLVAFHHYCYISISPPSGALSLSECSSFSISRSLWCLPPATPIIAPPLDATCPNYIQHITANQYSAFILSSSAVAALDNGQFSWLRYTECLYCVPWHASLSLFISHLSGKLNYNVFAHKTSFHDVLFFCECLIQHCMSFGAFSSVTCGFYMWLFMYSCSSDVWCLCRRSVTWRAGGHRIH